MKNRKIELKAFINGVEIESTGLYSLEMCIADELIDLSNDIAVRVVNSYTEEAEEVYE